MRTLLVFALSLTSVLAFDKPNIVFLLADDLGWTGLSSFGSDFYETPNLDRLAAQGMKFTDAYAACTVCSPTRASILTGKYPARLRLTDFIAGQNRPWAKLCIPDWKKGLPHEEITLAESLKDLGYRTGLIGKWHLNRPNHPEEDAPTNHGFDVVHQSPPGTRGYHLKDGGYLTDYLTDRAVDFIAESTTHQAPFFLYMAYNVPHTPIEGRADLVAAFTKKRNPKAVHHHPTYAAMVASLDDSVGRILQALEKAGISDNTLVIFTSDNGGLTQRYGKHDDLTENLPLRRGKGSAYEGGVRVPAIIKWPGITTAGTVCQEPIISIDYHPTILAAAGGPLLSGVDGRDLKPLLDRSARTLDRDLYWHYPHYHAGGDSPYSAIRSGRYRLIEFHEDQSLALVDLAEDLGEQANLSQTRPEVAAALKSKLDAWRQSVGAQMPTPNPNHDPARETEVSREGRRK